MATSIFNEHYQMLLEVKITKVKNGYLIITKDGTYIARTLKEASKLLIKYFPKE